MGQINKMLSKFASLLLFTSLLAFSQVVFAQATILFDVNSLNNRVEVKVADISENIKKYVIQVCKNKKGDFANYKRSTCEEFGDSWFENIELTNDLSALNRSVCLSAGPALYTVYAFIETENGARSTLQRDYQSDGSAKRSTSCLKVGDELRAALTYLENTKYVESHAQEIISLAQSITKSAKTNLQKSRAIYNWITNNIAYDVSIIKVDGDQISFVLSSPESALATLKKKVADCTGYAFLNAALHRAVGIHAKAVIGELRDEGFSVTHAWNEVLLDSAWRPQDPTLDSGVYEIRGGSAVFIRDVQMTYFNNSTAFAKTHFKKNDYKF